MRYALVAVGVGVGLAAVLGLLAVLGAVVFERIVKWLDAEDGALARGLWPTEPAARSESREPFDRLAEREEALEHAPEPGFTDSHLFCRTCTRALSMVLLWVLPALVGCLPSHARIERGIAPGVNRLTKEDMRIYREVHKERLKGPVKVRPAPVQILWLGGSTCIIEAHPL